VARIGKRRGAYRVKVGRPGGERQLGRPWPRLQYIIKVDFQIVGWEVFRPYLLCH
jgi:hypothetical protein